MKFAVLALALSGASATRSVRGIRLAKRGRPLKEEAIKIAKYGEHAKLHLAKFDSVLGTPTHESTAYWAYPLTLDYVVDVAVSLNGTDSDLYEYPVIVDTGSSNMAMAVAACTNCESGATELEVGLEDQCIEVTYGSGSWSGQMTNNLNMGFKEGEGGALLDSVVMAGITTQDGFFGGGFNGILGLAYPDLAEPYTSCSASATAPRGEKMATDVTTYATPLMDSMYADGLMTSNAFTILFCNDYATLGLGGLDESTIIGNVTRVDVKQTYERFYGYYLVQLNSVVLDGTLISNDLSALNAVGGVLVDSGTTLIYLPSSVTSKIETQITESVSVSSKFFEWESCIYESELELFPQLSLQLDGYTLELAPRQYMLSYGSCFYWGIGSSSIGIIGNIALQEKVVLFDRDTNQLGFAEGVCDTTSSSDSTVAEVLSAAAAATAVNVSPFMGTPLALVAALGAVAAVVAAAARWRVRYVAIPSNNNFLPA
jgi:hypothetical protein